MANDKGEGLFGAIKKDFKEYWAAYGGWAAFTHSPYLWCAFVLAIFITTFAKKEWSWPNIAVSIIPNVLGFTLGGYAVMLSFGDRRFQDAVRGANPDGKTSPYLFMSASLLHFILFQIAALVVSVICQAIDVNCYISFAGCWLFIYSILLAIAASFSIFFFSRMYDVLPNDAADREEKKSRF